MDQKEDEGLDVRNHDQLFFFKKKYFGKKIFKKIDLEGIRDI